MPVNAARSVASPQGGSAGAGTTVPPSQVMSTVAVPSPGSHAEPGGAGPSPTWSFTVALPASVQVNVEVAELGVPNEPVVADQAYVSADGAGPLAVASSVTTLPTLVSIALAVSERHAGQARLAADVHASCTATSDVARAAIANGAAPEQAAEPFVDVPLSEIR